MPSASSQKFFAFHFFERLPARITFGGGVLPAGLQKFKKGLLDNYVYGNAFQSRSRVCVAPFQRWLPRSYDFLLTHITTALHQRFRFFVCLSKQDGMDWMALRSGVLGFKGEALLFCVRGINSIVSLFLAHSRSSRLSRLDHPGQTKTTYGLPVSPVRHAEICN